MNEFFIKKHSVHLWRVFVPDLLPQVENLSFILSRDEIQRAARFHFDEHRNRFIIARAVLRLILSLYTRIEAKNLIFINGQRGKPFLSHHLSHLQFNVSHSHDMAVYALTSDTEIGIDIEKIEPDFSEDVAERFFSSSEYAEFSKLPQDKKIVAFYHLWAGKEAIIKALGEGLYVPLDEFSLDAQKKIQRINLTHQQHEYHYHLEYFSAHKQYQSAFATAQHVNHLDHWQWSANGPVRIQACLN